MVYLIGGTSKVVMGTFGFSVWKPIKRLLPNLRKKHMHQCGGWSKDSSWMKYDPGKKVWETYFFNYIHEFAKQCHCGTSPESTGLGSNF